MKVFITGAKGQLGNELVPLFAATHDVVAVDIEEVDLTDRDAVLQAITGTAPDLVVHGAAMTAVDRCETEPDLAYKVNSMGTRYVADGARRVGAHMVYVSTDYVFDGTKDEPYVEWDAPNPTSVYGRSKLGGERELDPGWTICRTSWVCGYHGANMVKTVLQLADERDELAFVDDQIGHPTLAADLAAIVHRLAVGRIPGLFHTTNQGAVSWYEFVRSILEAAGKNPDMVKPVKTADLQPPRPALRPANSVLDNAALRLQGLPLAPDYRESLAPLVARLQAT